MRISDWSSDVCSSDLALHGRIVDQFISDLGNASLHRDIELEIGGKFFQPLLSLRTQRMGGVFSHLPKQLVQAANNGVGEIFIKAGPPQHLARFFVHHLPDEMLDRKSTRLNSSQ